MLLQRPDLKGVLRRYKTGQKMFEPGKLLCFLPLEFLICEVRIVVASASRGLTRIKYDDTYRD